jgi:four helix bundle protein
MIRNQENIECKSHDANEKIVFDIFERLFIFSERILDIAESLPDVKGCNILCDQLVKSGTSIGANMEEADGTVTKRDFINKVTISRNEARETRYWLKLISKKYIDKEELVDDIQEINEIIKILSAIINNTKNPKKVH